MRVLTVAAVACMSASCGQAPTGNDTDTILSAPKLPEVKPGPNTLFVKLERVQRRTCPDMTCGEVGWISERQTVENMELREGWVRITRTYDAACVNGVSKYVDAGKATCTKDNGIENGQFAEWVPMSALSSERPADPVKTATADETFIAQSDDFKRYRASFVKVSNELISDGRCTKADFVEMGGWLKSVNDYKAQPVYFTYCGGMTAANKIYMNAETSAVL